MKRSISIILCLHMLTAPLFGNAPLNEQQQPTTLHQSIGSNHKLISKLLITTLAAEILFLHADDATKQRLGDQLHPKNIVFNFLTEYTTHAAATFFHELGHATAARLLTHNTPTIHLGGYKEHDPLIDLGSIKIDGIDPTTGLTRNISARQKLKDAIILLAGGCSAIVSHYVLKFLWAYGNQVATTGDRSMASAYTQALTPDTILIEQLVTMLLPHAPSTTTLSDGGRLWKNCLGANNTVIDIAGTAAPLVSLAAGLALLKETRTGQQPSAVDQFLISVINEQLRGYLHFTA